jgi:DNA-binding protein HU-beta
MTKNEIAKKLAEQTDLTVSQATHAVESVVSILTEAIAGGDTVVLRGFATIKAVQRAERVARDLNTGDLIHIPSRRRVQFTTGNHLQASIDEHGHK